MHCNSQLGSDGRVHIFALQRHPTAEDPLDRDAFWIKRKPVYVSFFPYFSITGHNRTKSLDHETNDQPHHTNSDRKEIYHSISALKGDIDIPGGIQISVKTQSWSSTGGSQEGCGLGIAYITYYVVAHCTVPHARAGSSVRSQHGCSSRTPPSSFTMFEMCGVRVRSCC